MEGDSPAIPRRPRLSVVTGTYNRLDMLKRFVDSVRAQRFDGELELVIVDGGSSDGSREWLVEQSDVLAVLEHNRNPDGSIRFGWPVCYNRAFGAAASDLICMLNDDLVIEPDCLERGTQIMERDSVCGGVAFWFHDECDPKGYRIGYTVGGKLFVNYGIYRAELWRQVGGFDGDTYRFYHADGDFALKLWELGRPILVAKDCRVRHFPNYEDPQRKANVQASQEAGDWQHYIDSWKHLWRQPNDNGFWQYLSGEVVL